MSTQAIVVSSPTNEGSAIAMCEKASAYLDRAESLWEVKKVHDMAEMIRQWMRNQKASDAAKERASRLSLEAARKGGEISKALAILTKKEAGDLGNRGAGTVVVPAKTPKKTLLSEIGLTKKEASEWERMSSVPEDQFRAYLDSGQEVTKTGLLRLASGGKLAAFSSESVEWYTPLEYIEAARKALGGTIDLDPASCAKANEVVKARRFFTREDDALRKKWKADAAWLNPPYADDGKTDTGDWVTKMVEEHRAGNLKSGVLLVNAVTDRKWFRQLFDFAICFTDHRIEFYTPDGQPKSPIAGNVFVYFGAARKRFAAAFKEFGSTVELVG